MRAGLLLFPGSICDEDILKSLRDMTGHDPLRIDYKDNYIPDYLDLLVLPGGFSFGDYRGGGTLAAHTSIMSEVRRQADRGMYILGICNGFQILTQAGILEGNLIRNDCDMFLSGNSHLSVNSNNSAFTRSIIKETILTIPVAHGYGKFVCDEYTMKTLEDEDRIIFKYLLNENGSLGDVAGIASKNGRVLGMMPHPERTSAGLFNTNDGNLLFESVVNCLKKAA